MSRPIPHDLDAERHLIGTCLIRPDAIGEAEALVDPSDFLGEGHGDTFAAIVDLWRAGEPVSAWTVAQRLNGAGMTGDRLVEAQHAVPTTMHAARYARTIAEHRARRRLIDLASRLVEMGYDRARPPGEVVDAVTAELDSIDLPSTGVPDDLHRLADLMNRPEADRMPWVVPGLLRQDWRVVVVAPEGVGKSLVLQQVGMAAAQGVHPFGFEPTDPVRVLFVDLENPEERIVHGARLIDPHARRLSAAYDEDRVWIWNRQGGVNLRARADRAALEAVLKATRPSLVCMGPAYKASVKEKGEGWDEAALATQRTLDQLRTRYGFALLMEDHAPQSSGGVRDLRPFGSSVWLRWPEIGLKLAPDGMPAKVLTLARWRGDRLPNGWPDELHRGDTWPWVGRWEDVARRRMGHAA